MADTERDVPQNEFELEITDLEPKARPARWPQRRLTPGQRKWSLALTAVLFVLVVVVILASTGDVRNLLARTLFPAQPTAVNNNLFFYLEENPSWGSFVIDGRPVTHLPVAGHDQPLQLAPGRHTIVWKIAPFKDQTCIFDVVDISTISGSCLLNSEVTADFVPNVSAMVLSFFATMNDLLPGQRPALLQQLQAVIAGYDGSALVQPGELYAVSEQQAVANQALCHPIASLAVCYARANQPLQATLSAQLDSSSSSTDPCVLSGLCAINQQDCRTFCNDDARGYADGVTGWNVLAIINLSWSYATSSGQVIARDQPDSALRGNGDYQFIEVHITRDRQGWHLFPFPRTSSSDPADPVCNQATQDIYGLTNAVTGNQQVYVLQSVDVQSTSASGCLVVIQSSPGTIISSATPIPSANTQLTGYCLVRFGVVLTVNDQAHHFWPALPTVNAYERGLANEALATLPASS